MFGEPEPITEHFGSIRLRKELSTYNKLHFTPLCLESL